MNIKPHADKNDVPSIHELHLNNEPFFLIKSGQKTVELRLNDEKRKRIRLGDFLRFTLRGSEDIILARVTALYTAPSFEVLFEVGGILKKCAWRSLSPIEAADKMREFYSKEDEQAYGALGIEFAVIIKSPTETPIINI